MKLNNNILFRRLPAVLILVFLLFTSIDQGLAGGSLLSGIKQEPYPGFTPWPTYDPYPGVTPFPTYDPYPGITPTPGTTAQIPTVTSSTANPSQFPLRTPTAATLMPQRLTGTIEFEPLPTFELLFPGVLPPGTRTPDAESVALASVETEQESAPPSLFVGFLGVLIVVIWGLLGMFLVVFLKRVGY